MTLHEAIRKVLLEEGHPMSGLEIANRINGMLLYKRKDNTPVPSAQIEARVANYSDDFYIENGRIFLNEFNRDKSVEEQLFEKGKQLRNYFAHNNLFNEVDTVELILLYIDSKTRKHILQREIEEIFFQKLNQHINNKFERNNIIEFVLQGCEEIYTTILEHTSRTKAVKTICSYFISFQNAYRELPEFVVNILSQRIKKDRIHTIDIIDELIPIYLLDCLDEKEYYKINIESRNLRTKELSQLLFNTSGLQVITEFDSINSGFELGICIPPFGMRLGMTKWDNELETILEQYQRMESGAFQVFLGTTSVLYQKGQRGNIRNFMLREHQPTGIFTVPYNSQFTGIKSLAFIEFDHKNRTEEIFIGDFTATSSELDLLSTYFEHKMVQGVTGIITPNEINEQNHTWSPSRYITSHELKAIDESDTVELSEVVDSFRGRHVNRKALYQEGEIKYITTKDLEKTSDYFIFKENVLAIDLDDITGNIPRVKAGDILTTLIGNDLKPNIYKSDFEAIVDQNIIILRCKESILPEFLIHSLKSDLSLEQLNSFRKQGTGITNIPRANLLSIRIKLPSIDEQRKILLENRQFEFNESDIKLDSEEFNIIATLKHTLKQPLTTLSEDFKVLQSFIALKTKEGLLSEEDIIVSIFEGEDKSSLQKHSLKSTLSRCQRMINDAHDHLNKAEQLLRIDTIKPKFELTSIKTLLLSLEKDYPKIDFEFKGRDYELNIDKYSFRILLDNFIENANKHGFEEIKNPTVLFRTEIERDKFDIEYVKIQYLNNGEPMSNEITTDKFLRKNSKSNKSVGDGYGGHLINKISQMHKGIIEVDKLTAEKEIDYNVCFNIYLPKN